MLDGKANGCTHWFLYLRSAASSLEKPLLAGYSEMDIFMNGGGQSVCICSDKPTIEGKKMKEILCRTPRSMAMIEPHGNVVANRISSGGNFRDKGISYDQTGSKIKNA